VHNRYQSKIRVEDDQLGALPGLFILSELVTDLKEKLIVNQGQVRIDISRIEGIEGVKDLDETL